MDAVLKKYFEFLQNAAIIFGLLYLFLLSISLMGTAFKLLGKDVAMTLIRTTSHPVVGLFIGILATSIIQSSSATTSIVVGLVASGGLTVINAVPIIFGANIGTTITNIIVSYGHITRREEFRRAFSGAVVHDLFNILMVIILFPLELGTHFLLRVATNLSGIFYSKTGFSFAAPIKTITKPVTEIVKDLAAIHLSSHFAGILILIFSFILLFFSLFFITRFMKSLIIEKTEMVFITIIKKSGYICILIGTIFTVLVQSSSITTSILVPMLGAGIISIETVFPITIGANIGTTITAIIAALAGNRNALTIAFVHLLFNVIGLFVIYPFRFLRLIPIRLASYLGRLSSEHRWVAFLFSGFVFFILPFIFIFVSKILLNR